MVLHQESFHLLGIILDGIEPIEFLLLLANLVKVVQALLVLVAELWFRAMPVLSHHSLHPKH